jgi:hypothetical protein
VFSPDGSGKPEGKTILGKERPQGSFYDFRKRFEGGLATYSWNRLYFLEST